MTAFTEIPAQALCSETGFVLILLQEPEASVSHIFPDMPAEFLRYTVHGPRAFRLPVDTQCSAARGDRDVILRHYGIMA